MTRESLLDETRFSEAIRDPVWCHIWLTPEFRDITLSEPFLRLYRIKQLGPTEYVYPGATHSRASHSLGVYHVALRLLRVLLAKGADRWVTAEGCASFLAAALLHDLGHFPFTHSLKELPLDDHESLTGRAILTDRLSLLVKKAGGDPEMTATIVDKSRALPAGSGDETAFFRKLLSGVLDPDKLDYLNRDAYYCGVPYGIQDTDFILSRVMPDRERGLTLDRRAIMSVESVLFSKYLMYRSVYWHRQVRMATAMMKKTLFAALEGRFIESETLYTLDDSGIYAMIDTLNMDEKTLATDIRNRSFYQVVMEYPYDRENATIRALENLGHRSAEESRIATVLSRNLSQSILPLHILIDIPEDISFESDLFIQDENVTFSNSSTVFSSDVVARFSSSLRMVRVAVHPSIAQRVLAIADLPEKLAK
jgi:HD superfamily phosphohydrolase